MKTVSIVVPAKNEEATVGLVLTELQTVLRGLPGYVGEVICVDDHSTDRTAEVAGACGARVVRNSGPSGKGMALRTGFAAATGEILVMMDADYSHRPEDLPVFLAAIEKEAGLVIGSRIYGGSDEYTNVRAFGNVFLTLFCGLFLGRYLSDALNGYKVFRRNVFSDFRYTSTSFEIEIELVANALRKGYSIVEVGSHERARLAGEAKSRVLRHGSRFFIRILWEWFRNLRGRRMGRGGMD